MKEAVDLAYLIFKVLVVTSTTSVVITVHSHIHTNLPHTLLQLILHQGVLKGELAAMLAGWVSQLRRKSNSTVS